MNKIICKKCGKEFEVKKYRVLTARFCSYACNASFYFKGKKGRVLSVETKQKISKNNARIWAGKKRPDLHSKESRLKISLAHKGKPAWNKGIKGFRLGEKRPGIMPSGKYHWSWRGGVSRDSHSLQEPRYKSWRKSVFERDGFKCKIADEKCSGQLEAHHILRWSEFPELRYKINNGISLCHAHHPRKRAEEKRLVPTFQELTSVLKNYH